MERKSNAPSATFQMNNLKLTSKVMQPICEQFRSGNFKHDDVESVREQLYAESSKRTEAMLFEEVFQRLIIRACRKNVSFGWIGAFSYGTLCYWFRLETDVDKWNDCDSAIAQKLLTKKWQVVPKQSKSFEKGTAVFKVRFNPAHDGGNFLLSRMRNDGTFEKEIDEIMLYGKLGSESVRDSLGQDKVKQQRAITCVEYLKNGNLVDLSIRRRFMNCVIPAFGGSPIDLDAVLLTDDNKLRYVEFKRKYPSPRLQKFGLDQGHITVLQLMKDIRVTSLHVVLVSPDWTKDDPVLWYLDVANYGHKWAWVVATLDNISINGDASMKTQGEDSGHHGGERKQTPIEWDDCRLLSRGLIVSEAALAKLEQFLMFASNEDLMKIDYEELQKMTDLY